MNASSVNNCKTHGRYLVKMVRVRHQTTGIGTVVVELFFDINMGVDAINWWNIINGCGVHTFL